MEQIVSLSDIQHILYINLESRPDRCLHIETELSKFGWQEKATRFNAISTPNLGAIGCSLSHLKCMQLAKSQGWSHVLILEDDVVFTDPDTLQKHARVFFEHNVQNNIKNKWDVVLLSGNCQQPYKVLPDSSCVKISRCLTTAAYLVNAHYYDKLIQNFQEGIQLLVSNKKLKSMYAIDVYWFRLQEHDFWYLITPLTVTQRADYSDIENANTDFVQHFLLLH